jgi:hypothetical protein
MSFYSSVEEVQVFSDNNLQISMKIKSVSFW